MSKPSPLVSGLQVHGLKAMGETNPRLVIERLYVRYGFPENRIAEMFGVKRQSVNGLLDKFGIRRRSKGAAIDIDRRARWRGYNNIEDCFEKNPGCSAEQLASLLRVTPDLVVPFKNFYEDKLSGIYHDCQSQQKMAQEV